MTEKRNVGKGGASPTAILNRFHLEAERTASGVVILASGVIGVKEFSRESVELLTHSGRIFIYGKRLSILVFENGTVEIRGRIEDVRFGYGKN
jgi:hypothetical protein